MNYLNRVRIGVALAVPVLALELSSCGSKSQAQGPMNLPPPPVSVVEVKAAEFLVQRDRAQIRNYLACSYVEVGLLLHFGPKARFERMVHTNPRKPNLPHP